MSEFSLRLTPDQRASGSMTTLRGSDQFVEVELLKSAEFDRTVRRRRKRCFDHCGRNILGRHRLNERMRQPHCIT